MTSADPQTQFKDAAQRGDLATVQSLLSQVDPTHTGSQALTLAAWGGHLPVVQALAPLSPPEHLSSEDFRVPLTVAAEEGHLPVVRFLFSFSDAGTQLTALEKAAEYGHADLVRWLAEACALQPDQATPLQYAAEHGRVDAIRVLLPLTNARANDSYAFTLAVCNGHWEVAELLWPVSDGGCDGHLAFTEALASQQPLWIDRLMPTSQEGRMQAAHWLARQQRWDDLDQMAVRADEVFQKTWRATAPPGALPRLEQVLTNPSMADPSPRRRRP
jgi:hypothetical protein